MAELGNMFFVKCSDGKDRNVFDFKREGKLYLFVASSINDLPNKVKFTDSSWLPATQCKYNPRFKKFDCASNTAAKMKKRNVEIDDLKELELSNEFMQKLKSELN